MTERQLRADVERLAAPGGRLPGTSGHQAARGMISERMAALGMSPYADAGYELAYRAGALEGRNLLGVAPGRSRELPPVLVAAHYDTCGSLPGADDNAAAVAMLLETARRLREAPAERDVVFAFFDAEEPPHYLADAMGSTRFYHDQRRGPVHCAVVLDLCGHDVPIPGLEDLIFVTGVESDRGLQRVARRTWPASGLRAVLTLNRYIGDLSDHHVFRVNRRPYLFLSCGRWPHYHAPTDTPDRLNYAKMVQITAYAEALVRETAVTALDGPFEGDDTVEIEIASLQRAVGPFLDMLGLHPRTRADLDAMVTLLVQQFGL